MRAIIESLRGISDPYVQNILFNMDTSIYHASNLKDSLPKVNGLESYSTKIMDFQICALRIEFLGYLTEYMSQQQVQTFEVASDTMTKDKSDFTKFYKHKVEASQVLSNLNHSKLMMEVRWLLLNKPFNP
jgi:hypothetical protein